MTTESRKRHVIIGGGTAGLNAITTIREFDGGASDIILVSGERPYSRMVLPYYLGRAISESHVFTASPARLAQLGVQSYLGRHAAALDTANQTVTLDDGAAVPYDDLLIATGSSPVRAPVPGADGRNVHSFWTLEQARAVLAGIKPGHEVVMVGAGFIAFTILNAVLKLGAKLTVVEIAPQILPRMIDATGAEIVERWLTQHDVTIRTGARLSAIADTADGRKQLSFENGEPVTGDLVIMATGIRPNLAWLAGSAVRVNRGIVVDDRLRSSVPNIYAAGDVAEGRNVVSGELEVHAIEPTAMEHGRIVGANMAGVDRSYRGSLLMNIVDVLDLEIASFGAWEASGDIFTALRPEDPAYRKLLWEGDRLIGAIVLGMSSDIWATNDVGMLKGLVQSGAPLGGWKAHLRRNPFDVKKAFVSTKTVARLLPQTVLGRPSVPSGLVRAAAAAPVATAAAPGTAGAPAVD